MKVCLIGKYPPIEGGVSMQTYWMAHGLAERGHQVWVVTNAPDVELPYRMHLDPDDAPWYQPVFPSGGEVRVCTTETYRHARMGHIPDGDPVVTKLASRATQVVRAHGCDATFAYYFEPYAVAACLVARWTGIPLIIKHAGSDLDRLMRVPDLATTYQEVLRSADCVLTRAPLVDRFVTLGVDETRIYPDLPFGLPASVFNPEAPPLDPTSGLSLPQEWGEGERMDPRCFIDPSQPTIGIYGKAGPAKGSYDLIAALGDLKRAGTAFNFLAMTNGLQAPRFRVHLREYGLEECTKVLPFLPHWKVPRFIRACTAVCFLERDFPVAIHGPIIPREVLACGTCLVLSREIAEKQWYRSDLRDQVNVVLVDDPRDHAELASKLGGVIGDPGRARQIGREGHRVSLRLEDFPAYVDAAEALLGRFTADVSFVEPLTPLGRWLARGADVDEGWDALSSCLTEELPWVQAVLGQRFDALVGRFLTQTSVPRNRFRLALAFCDFLEAQIPDDRSGLPPGCLADVLRYQRAILRTAGIDESLSVAWPPTVRWLDNEVSKASILSLKPLRDDRASIEEFTYDVTPLFTEISSEQELTERPIARTPTSVLFGSRPNGGRFQVRVGAGARRVLDLSDGTRETREIGAELNRAYGMDRAADQAGVLDLVVDVLASFYQRGAVVFLDASSELEGEP